MVFINQQIHARCWYFYRWKWHFHWWKYL